MKKLALSVFFIVFLLSLCACANHASVPQNDKNENTVKTEYKSETNDANNPSSPANADNEKSYYGKWIITKAYDTNTVSTLSSDNINKFIGKEITYSSDSVVSNDDACHGPYYKETKYTEDDLELTAKLTFKDLGIQGDTLTWVEIYLDNNHETLWDNFADNFIIKDEDTLILACSGTYFELKRTQ